MLPSCMKRRNLKFALSLAVVREGNNFPFEGGSRHLLWQFCPGLLRHHVCGIPVGPILVAFPDAFLVLAMGSLRTAKRARLDQVTDRPTQ